MKARTITIRFHNDDSLNILIQSFIMHLESGLAGIEAAKEASVPPPAPLPPGGLTFTAAAVEGAAKRTTEGN